MADTSLEKDKIRVLLLEGIHENAVENLKANGYSNVELLPTALTGDDLTAKIKMPILLAFVPAPSSPTRCSRRRKS